MKLHPAAAKLFHGDGWTERQTDMTKLIVDFRNSTNALKTHHFKHILFTFLIRL
jgi:hypothetical protein